MAVVVIIGLLATAVGLGVEQHMRDARRTRVEADMRTILDAVRLFHLKQGRRCRDLDELVAQGNLEAPPVDPWGNAYSLEEGGEGGRPVVVCLGADGAPGGAGDEADLRSTELLAPASAR
jgi:general secretion pathway protein G